MPGGFYNSLLPYTFPLGPGNYELEFGFNDAPPYTETSEPYSFSISAVASTPPSLPDLHPEVLVVNPGTVQAGSSINVQYDIYNVGSATAGASETTVYLSKANDINSGDVISSATLSDPSVAAASYFGDSTTLNIPSSLSGTYYVIVDANSNNAIEESSTANNTISSPLNVTATREPLPPDDFDGSGTSDLLIKERGHPRRLARRK